MLQVAGELTGLVGADDSEGITLLFRQLYDDSEVCPGSVRCRARESNIIPASISQKYDFGDLRSYFGVS